MMVLAKLFRRRFMEQLRNWALAIILFTNVMFFQLINGTLEEMKAIQFTYELNRIEMEYDIISVIRYGERVEEAEASLRQ
jgi:hypothetical protein